MGPYRAQWGQMGPNKIKTGPKWSKMGSNGDTRGQLGQNLFKDGDCLRVGEFPRYFP